jgi:SAM-dependent methyltransferase
MPLIIKKKNDWQGAWRVVRFNWPFYFFAALLTLALLAVASSPTQLPIRAFCLVGGLLICLQTLLSIAASHWVYDLSPLRDWRFVSALLPGQATCIINIHSGYDETTSHLLKIFPDASLQVIDLYPALGRREPSIVRARHYHPPTREPISTAITGWPVDAGSADLVLIAFAAHELRAAEQRVALLKQARSVLKSDGRIILVEHVRDGANFLAFNLGMLHFYSAREWLRCSEKAGLNLHSRAKITPLVEILTLCP